jgi:CheY-like chemotaxis protein
MKMTTKPLEILLVEDNKGDVGLIIEFFSDAKVITNIHIAEDGEEVLRFYTSRYNYFGFKFIKKRRT